MPCFLRGFLAQKETTQTCRNNRAAAISEYVRYFINIHLRENIYIVIKLSMTFEVIAQT